MIWCHYDPSKDLSRVLCEAFVEGCPKAKLVNAAQQFRQGPTVLYGVQKHTQAVWDHVRKTGQDYWYIDNGYFSDHLKPREERYYRIVKNGLHDQVPNDPDWQRWERLGIKIEPWREGKHILVLPPLDRWMIPVMGVKADTWLEPTLAKIHSDRELRVRFKPKKRREFLARPIEADLRGAHAVVTFLSAVAYRAACAGIAVFVDKHHGALPMGSSDLSFLDNPPRPEGREEWAATLAGRQWTIEEIRSGMAWEKLNARCRPNSDQRL